ncbi:MAG: lipid-A-disaccharide synthase [Gemmatimonadetes bacterium]|nr:lipid-A-disaccharide synthase [Gemmatimonadota bacterium]
MGLTEVVRTIPYHGAMLSDLARRFRAGRYDLLVLVDYPGFNVRLAGVASAADVPVLYYIAPQLWAWGSGRASKLRSCTRELAVVLPFEESFFRRLDIRATFVGHPLLDRPSPPSRALSRERIGLTGSGPVLGIFPGSRAQEVGRMWPLFRQAARLVEETCPEVQVVVAGCEDFPYPEGDGFIVHRDAPDEVLSTLDAALCKSGTITLQAALAEVPIVIAYRMHPVTHFIARRVLTIPRIGLVNLIAGRDVAPELIQGAATPQALAAAALSLLDRGSSEARAQREAFPDVRSRLGTPGAAERVAAIAARLVA